MNYDEQLQRMIDNGAITPSQAEKLKQTLSRPAPEPTQPKRKAVLFSTGICLLLIVLIGLLFTLTNNNITSGTTTVIEDVRQTLNQPGELGAMNSVTSGIIAILLFLILPLLLFVFSYNSIVGKEEAVYQSWAQVESNYQRRADLIPNLVETVSRYLQHESDTLTNVTDARSQDFEAIIDKLIEAQANASELFANAGPDATSSETYLAEVDASQRLIGSQMSRLLATVEAYPDLRSSEQMLQLQAQLEGTENRINIARIRFNDAVERFNKSIRILPGSLVAGISNFKRKAYFQSQSGAAGVPDVGFESDNH